MSDTDEEPPLPPPPLAEVLPMTLHMAMQGTTVEELGELLSVETWGRLAEAERQQLCQLLPPGDPEAVVRGLFNREALQLRPPPLDLFWGQLNKGDFSIEGLKRNQARGLHLWIELLLAGPCNKRTGHPPLFPRQFTPDPRPPLRQARELARRRELVSQMREHHNHTVRLQPLSHTVTASITYGYGLYHMRLRPLSHAVTASLGSP